MIEIVKQSKSNSCVAAVLAMIVGESEQYVLDWHEYIDTPYDDQLAMIFLAHHGVFFSTCALITECETEGGEDISKYDYLQLDIDLKTCCAYVIVESKTKGLTHAVYLRKGKIYDPLHDRPQKLRGYMVKALYPVMETEVRYNTLLK